MYFVTVIQSAPTTRSLMHYVCEYNEQIDRYLGVSFYYRASYASTVLAVICQSVCLSVCL